MMKLLSPKKMLWLFRLYPPYLGAGIWVDYVSDDWKEVKISMRKRWYTRNAFNTHFGGSLYSMIDPFFVMLLWQLLGESDYIVWDQSAKIHYKRAVRGKVSATIRVTDKQVDEIRSKAKPGEKQYPVFSIDIVSEDNKVIATVEKTLYVKMK